MGEMVIRKVVTYKRTKSFTRWCRKVRNLSRGACERCGGKCGPDHLTVDHIMGSRIYPEFARESCNFLLLCGKGSTRRLIPMERQAEAERCNQSSLLTHLGRVGKGCPCRASGALNILGQCIISLRQAYGSTGVIDRKSTR